MTAPADGDMSLLVYVVLLDMTPCISKKVLFITA